MPEGLTLANFQFPDREGWHRPPARDCQSLSERIAGKLLPSRQSKCALCKSQFYGKDIASVWLSSFDEDGRTSKLGVLCRSCSYMATTERERTRTRAADPFSSPENVESAWRSGDPVSMAAAVSNPQVPLSVLVEASAHPSPVFRFAAASSPRLPENAALTLAVDADERVRAAVVANLSLREAVRTFAAIS